jgi:hypothetical protein
MSEGEVLESGGGCMKIRFRTESNSLYLIDTDAMTWERTHTTEKSGRIRSETGKLLAQPEITIGEPAFLEDASVLPGHATHHVMTSRVMEVSVE